MVATTTANVSSNEDKFPEFHSGWAFSKDASELGRRNREALEWFMKNYNIAFKQDYRSRLHYMINAYGEEKARAMVAEQERKESEADVLIERDEAGYSNQKYRILRNTPNLSSDALALVCDSGNLCFGYRTQGDFIIVYTD